MKELAKTIGFVAVAGAAIGLVYNNLPLSSQVVPQPVIKRTAFAFNPANDPSIVGYCIYWGGHPTTRTNHLNIGSNLVFTVEHYESSIDAVGHSHNQFHVESWPPTPPAGVHYYGTKDVVFAQTNSTPVAPGWADAFQVTTLTNSTPSLFYRLRIERMENKVVYP